MHPLPTLQGTLELICLLIFVGNRWDKLFFYRAKLVLLPNLSLALIIHYIMTRSETIFFYYYYFYPCVLFIAHTSQRQIIAQARRIYFIFSTVNNY